MQRMTSLSPVKMNVARVFLLDQKETKAVTGMFYRSNFAIFHLDYLLVQLKNLLKHQNT